jgi:hypothetical protein
MNSIAFSAATLTESEARQIAEAYVKGDKDPLTMAKMLGVDSFDLNLIMNPAVRRFIIAFQRAVRAEYSLANHISKLKEIRDAALGEDNFKVALAAETQLGKAAGLYDPKPLDPNGEGGLADADPTKLTTDELRRRLAKQIGAVIPQPSLQDHSDAGDDD